MSLYEDLVMQTQMNYSRYYSMYAEGKTPVQLSEKAPLCYERQVEEFAKKVKEAECIIVGGASGLSSAGGADFYYGGTKSFHQYFGKFAEKYGFGCNDKWKGFSYLNYQSRYTIYENLWRESSE